MIKTREKRRPTRFFVEYNGKIMGSYKYLSGALNLIKRKPWKDDFDNTLWLYDNNGDHYSPFSGVKKNHFL